MNGLLDGKSFSQENGEMLVQLATMSEYGNSPVKIQGLSELMQLMVTKLLDLTDAERTASGITLWGPIGSDGKREYIGVRVPINALGYAVFDNEPISQLH